MGTYVGIGIPTFSNTTTVREATLTTILCIQIKNVHANDKNDIIHRYSILLLFAYSILFVYARV